ncbi:hypothetical protein BWQ96_10835 [Gracilariopsis chorda]|uniref:Uncharacterized protein n=1 Tax=Gracilariopsis chorda TaxID=448386 RepID=A0A2V3IBJ0_9FLOR|nr:hypothetical protein BWQ96_10835 [Gracilariopsis chorda]|eukprot:PXF39477.1 hypothetical protein BWQ96_10835 [Gracilariopsis chorda]
MGLPIQRSFFLFELNDTAQLVNTTLETSNHSIITSYVIKVDQISDTLFNITATLFFEYLPGEAVYQIAARTESPGGASIYTMERNHSVYGMAFYDDSHGTMALISGDFGTSQNVPREVAFNPTANVLFNRVHGAMLEDDDVSIDGDGLYIKLRPHGIGSALITIESSNLVVDGESFETAVIVRVRDVPE